MEPQPEPAEEAEPPVDAAQTDSTARRRPGSEAAPTPLAPPARPPPSLLVGGLLGAACRLGCDGGPRGTRRARRGPPRRLSTALAVRCRCRNTAEEKDPRRPTQLRVRRVRRTKSGARTGGEPCRSTAFHALSFDRVAQEASEVAEHHKSEEEIAAIRTVIGKCFLFGDHLDDSALNRTALAMFKVRACDGRERAPGGDGRALRVVVGEGARQALAG